MADKSTTPISIPELSVAPDNPSSGYQKIYAKSDGKLYVRTSAGVETELTNASGTVNIYTTDGTLSGPRIVTLSADNQLSIRFSDLVTALYLDDSTGNIILRGRDDAALGPGDIKIEAGYSSIDAYAGDIDILTQEVTGAHIPGNISIVVGDAGSSLGGRIKLQTGKGGASGGKLEIITGESTGGNGGDIEVTFGSGNTNDGRVKFTNYAGQGKRLLNLDNDGYMFHISSKILTLEFGVSSGEVITTGAKGRKACTVSGTIKGWKLITDTDATVTVDVWKANNSIPTNANSITASAKPSITAGQYASSTTLTGWTNSVFNNDVFVFEVESNDNAKYILLILEIEI